MRYIRSGSLKKLFSAKRRSFEDEIQTPNGCAHEDGNENFRVVGGYETEHHHPPQKPTWKCFSYEEIFHATSGFCSGFDPVS